MQIRPGLHIKKLLSLLGLPLLIAFVFLESIKHGNLFIILAVVSVSSTAWIILRLNLQAELLKVLAISLPFSIGIPFGTGARMQFPGEMFTGIAATVLILDIILKPGNFYKYFKKDAYIFLPLLVFYVISVFFSTMPKVSVKFVFINLTYILVFYFFLKQQFSKDSGIFVQLISLYSLGYLVVVLIAGFRFWQYDLNPVVVKGIFRPFYKDHTISGASAAKAGG